MAGTFPSVVIENLQPLIEGGRYPIMRTAGEDLAVDADIFKDGHDVVAAVLKWRVLGKRAWRETPMTFVDNDRWRGVCTLYDEAIHEYTVEAWTDSFRSWQSEFAKKFDGGISDLRSEALEGAASVEAAARRARDRADAARLREFSEQIATMANSEIYAIAQSGELEVDRKSTRLNSSHLGISYAVFCLKKKKKENRYNNIVYTCTVVNNE